MQRGDDLAKVRKQGTKEAFVEAFPGLWLVTEHTTIPAGGFRTTPWNPAALEEMLSHGGEPSLLMRLRCEPARYELWPIAKHEGNPWPDRIFVGRTQNNDIVLVGSSISKQHAFFVKSATGEWTLSDTGSTNGTRVDGIALAPEVATPVRSGSAIVFGEVICQLATSDALFDRA